MLVVQGKHKIKNPKLYTSIHKASGYIFALLFLVMFVGMVIRVRNYWEESSARIAIHVVLAVALLFILAIKILIPRFFKRLSGYLFPLGIVVYAMSFSLVVINVGYYAIWKTAKQAPSMKADIHLADDTIGKMLFIEKCSICHDLPTIMKPRNALSWDRVVDRMVEIAAPRITPDEGKIISAYLAKTHSPQPVIEKPEMSILERHCYPCHKSTEILSIKHTRTEWIEIVKQMSQNDPNIVPLDKLDEIVNYLIAIQDNPASNEQPPN